MFGMQSKKDAAAEILAFTRTASPATRTKVINALNSGMSARMVAKSIRNAKVQAATGNF